MVKQPLVADTDVVESVDSHTAPAKQEHSTFKGKAEQRRYSDQIEH